MPHEKRNPGSLAAAGASENDHAGALIGSEGSTTDAPAQCSGRLVDRFGHEHSEAILKNWSAAALAAMGIRRTDGGQP